MTINPLTRLLLEIVERLDLGLFESQDCILEEPAHLLGSERRLTSCRITREDRDAIFHLLSFLLFQTKLDGFLLFLHVFFDVRSHLLDLGLAELEELRMSVGVARGHASSFVVQDAFNDYGFHCFCSFGLCCCLNLILGSLR